MKWYRLFAPLLVLWFGYEMTPKIILIVISTFFPVAVGLLDGFRSADKDAIGLLRAMGAEVHAAARKDADRMRMRAMGIRPLSFREITERYDLIFNTVPATVIGPPVLNRQTPETCIIELASAPGGIDRDAAAFHPVIWALSLPGKVAPVTAGGIIADTVRTMLTEVGLC